jgi:hypothetical protein
LERKGAEANADCSALTVDDALSTCRLYLNRDYLATHCLMKSKEKARDVAGVAWYRREQWQRLREISADGDDLEESYEAWLAEAERVFRYGDLSRKFQKVDVDVEQLLAWCNENGRPVDSKARAHYAAEVLRTRDSL